MLERLRIISPMNKLPIDRQVRVISSLVEGNSIRATVRMTGVAKNTVVKLLAELGEACADYQNETMRNLPCKRIQCDEIWSFVYAKARNAPADLKAMGKAGDVWTWTAIDADTRLIVSWMVGTRTTGMANVFIADLAQRLSHRVQLTTDGHKAYLRAVEDSFGIGIDYAMLVKLYGEPRGSAPERRYSTGECCGTIKGTVCGNPDDKHVSTSYVERQNLTMRMGMRRFTRLTNAFSKKIENHEHAVALHFMYYNFCRIHQSLRITPAMAAGLSDHVWEIDEMLALLGGATQKLAA
jgi:IS1 family transposase